MHLYLGEYLGAQTVKLDNLYRTYEQKGVGPFTIKDLAGHKSLNITMRYIRVENKEQAEVIDRLEFGEPIADTL